MITKEKRDKDSSQTKLVWGNQETIIRDLSQASVCPGIAWGLPQNTLYSEYDFVMIMNHRIIFLKYVGYYIPGRNTLVRIR